MFEEFTCENCQEDYFTYYDWEDECYCKNCYYQKFLLPQQVKDSLERGIMEG